MKIENAIKILEKHNKWRRGDDSIEMEDPVKIGMAIDTILKFAKKRLYDEAITDLRKILSQ